MTWHRLTTMAQWANCVEEEGTARAVLGPQCVVVCAECSTYPPKAVWTRLTTASRVAPNTMFG